MYETLDAQILFVVEQGRHPLYDSQVCAESNRIARLTDRKGFRVIDGRLQALRKAGKIRADRKTRGWSLT